MGSVVSIFSQQRGYVRRLLSDLQAAHDGFEVCLAALQDLIDTTRPNMLEWSIRRRNLKQAGTLRRRALERGCEYLLQRGKLRDAKLIISLMRDHALATTDTNRHFCKWCRDRAARDWPGYATEYRKLRINLTNVIAQEQRLYPLLELVSHHGAAEEGVNHIALENSRIERVSWAIIANAPAIGKVRT